VILFKGKLNPNIGCNNDNLLQSAVKISFHRIDTGVVDKVVDKVIDKLVDKSFFALKKQGRLERIGSNKDGYWRVMDSPET